MKHWIVGLAGLVAPVSCLGEPSAAVVVYTDRSTWEATAGVLTTEDFNSLADLTVVSPTTVFPSGITITPANPGETDISDFAFGDIGEGTALRTFDDYTVDFPTTDVAAFGFDYVDLDRDGADVAFGTFAHALALTGDADTGVTPDDFAFFGVVVDNPSEIGGSYSIVITAFEGFCVDNLSFVPEPSTLLLLSMGAVGLLLYAWRKRRRR